MHNFTPLPSLIGGILIGLSASIMLLMTGQVTGISGILGGAITKPRQEGAWRIAFLVGLLFAGVVGVLVAPAEFVNTTGRSILMLVGAGFLVGFGTRLGNGCTSGHGVCGISRFSPRSLVATLSFIATGMLAVWLVRAVGG